MAQGIEPWRADWRIDDDPKRSLAAPALAFHSSDLVFEIDYGEMDAQSLNWDWRAGIAERSEEIDDDLQHRMGEVAYLERMSELRRQVMVLWCERRYKANDGRRRD